MSKVNAAIGRTQLVLRQFTQQSRTHATVKHGGGGKAGGAAPTVNRSPNGPKASEPEVANAGSVDGGVKVSRAGGNAADSNTINANAKPLRTTPASNARPSSSPPPPPPPPPHQGGGSYSGKPPGSGGNSGLALALAAGLGVAGVAYVMNKDFDKNVSKPIKATSSPSVGAAFEAAAGVNKKETAVIEEYQEEVPTLPATIDERSDVEDTESSQNEAKLVSETEPVIEDEASVDEPEENNALDSSAANSTELSATNAGTTATPIDLQEAVDEENSAGTEGEANNAPEVESISTEPDDSQPSPKETSSQSWSEYLFGAASSSTSPDNAEEKVEKELPIEDSEKSTEEDQQKESVVEDTEKDDAVVEESPDIETTIEATSDDSQQSDDNEAQSTDSSIPTNENGSQSTGESGEAIQDEQLTVDMSASDKAEPVAVDNEATPPTTATDTSSDGVSEVIGDTVEEIVVENCIEIDTQAIVSNATMDEPSITDAAESESETVEEDKNEDGVVPDILAEDPNETEAEGEIAAETVAEPPKMVPVGGEVGENIDTSAVEDVNDGVASISIEASSEFNTDCNDGNDEISVDELKIDSPSGEADAIVDSDISDSVGHDPEVDDDIVSAASDFEAPADEIEYNNKEGVSASGSVDTTDDETVDVEVDVVNETEQATEEPPDDRNEAQTTTQDEFVEEPLSNLATEMVEESTTQSTVPVVNSVVVSLSAEAMDELNQKRLGELERFVKELEAALAQTKTLEELRLFKLKSQFEKYLERLEVEKIDEFKSLEAAFRQQSKEDLERQYYEMRTSFLTVLQQQEEIHENTIDATIGDIALRARKKSEAEVMLQLGAERAGRIVKLEQMYVRLKQLEKEMRSRMKLDKSAAAALHMMTATDALRETFEKRGPLFAQVKHLRKLAGEDTFVQTVLDGIPEESLLRGANTEAQITSAFAGVRSNVRRVQHVPEDGGIFAHTVSAIISFITFARKGLAEGSTPDAIMARAEYYIEQGDLEQATIEVNKLTGVPRSQAISWLRASRAFLETKQAIDLCYTHCGMLRMSML